MRPMSWKVWDLFRRSNRSISRARWQRRNACQPEILEPRTVLTGNATGVISGVAFIDGDGDGQKDANERGVAGVVITLAGKSNGGVAVNATATTKADGTYSFINVLTGSNYTLSSGTATGLSGTQTFSLPNIVGTGGATVTQNFAFTNGILVSALSVRQFTTQTAVTDFPFAAAGTTDGLAAATDQNRDNAAPTLAASAVTNLSRTTNAPTEVIDLAGDFTDANYTNSTVRLKTTVGGTARDVNIELFDSQTPQTVANFFNYANDDRYDDTFFHRLVSGFVIQGGGFAFDDNANTIVNVGTDPAIENEFSVTRSNLRGTVAMAKLGGDPNSATSQFFINLGNNAANLDNQNGGFTVFGKLLDTADQTAADALAATTIRDQSAANGALGEVPLSNFAGTNDDPNFLTTVAATNFVRITNVEVTKRDEFLLYSIVSNDNSLLVNATIENNRLTLDYAAGQVGVANIVVRATDKFGATVDATYQVTVIDT